MTIIQGRNPKKPTDRFPAPGLATFKAGQNNVTAPHHHECEEFVFMIDEFLDTRR